MLRYRQLVFCLAFAVALIGSGSVGWGWQDDEQEPAPAAIDEELLALKKVLKSPKQSVVAFIEAMRDQDLALAYQCFDLSDLDVETAEAKRKTYAVKLQIVFKNLDLQLLQTISDDPDEPEQPYPVFTDSTLNEIQLVRDGNELWKFSKSTIKFLDGEAFDELFAIPTLQEDTSEGVWSLPLWIQQRFPESWWGTTFYLKDYQWVCLLVLLGAGFLIGQLVKILLDYLTRLWFRATSTDIDDLPRVKLWAPVVSLIHIWIWYWGTTLIDLPSQVMGVLLPVLKFFTVLAAVWTAFRAINLLQNYLAKKARLTASRYDDSLVPLVCSALKLVAVVLGIVIFVDVFDKDWKAVLGGFGVVGIAVAIAAKDMLGNVFGSITVLADRPFEIGDWVVIDDKVEGTVEHVGIRSSRLRTFHNSEIIVPNSLLTTAIVDNMGRRRYRRFKTHLQIRFDTPVDTIEDFCAGVRKLINENPYARNENAHVYVNQFSENSIDILIYVFFGCSDWNTELRERHCLLIDILKLAEQLKVGFAFPTRTIEFSKSELNEQLAVDRPGE